jgi:hypothetical protein
MRSGDSKGSNSRHFGAVKNACHLLRLWSLPSTVNSGLPGSFQSKENNLHVQGYEIEFCMIDLVSSEESDLSRICWVGCLHIAT